MRARTQEKLSRVVSCQSFSPEWGLEKDIVMTKVIPSKGEVLFQRNPSLVEDISKREIGVTLSVWKST